jgi:hypothetical protein
MEHTRLMVIDPNDGMIVMLIHGIGPFSTWLSLILQCVTAPGCGECRSGQLCCL